MSEDPSLTPATARPSRKAALKEFAARWALRRNDFIERGRAFHEQDHRYLRFLIPEGLKVLEVGCGTGQLLAALKPAKGVGVDISPEMIGIARAHNPTLDFIIGDIETPETVDALGGPYDVIVLSDTIGLLEDCQNTLAGLRKLCTAETRIVISYYNYLWEPVLKLTEFLGLRMPSPLTNWLKPADIANLLMLVDFEVVREDWRQLIPMRLLGLGSLINRFVATLPLIRRFCLRNYLVARPLWLREKPPASVSVIIPCRNERGNVEPIVQRLPKFCDDIEIVFIEGHSSDGTYEEMERVAKLYPDRDIKLMRQTGRGKGNAVYEAFTAARGELLMILDADMTVAPEDLPKFYQAVATDKGEFVNGSRLVYPREEDAMRLLNLIANHGFSIVFSWLLNQRFTDTLCGTKVLRRHHWDSIQANRAYFGDFDPFGDFDLIFGASKLNLKIVEIPIPYAARLYGETQISRFSHGWLLLRMVSFAYFKLKTMR